MLAKNSQWLWLLILITPLATASHSFGGLDMCALYPEVMPPGLPAKQLPDRYSAPAQMMQTYCTQCHNLPGLGRHTASEWPSVLERMTTLMEVANRFGGLLGNVKSPTTEEREQLQQYLTQYALKPLQQKPEGLGARAFENHCGACHAAPDPLQYQDTNWSELLKRMQRNMVVMKYTLPSSEVMLQIQHYLELTKPQGPNSFNSISPSRISTANKKNASPINLESWLALGPFLLLVILGLARWWISSHKRLERQIHPQS